MSPEFIISQVFVAIQYALLIASYCTKNRKALLAINFASNVSVAVSYILLGAWSGFASSMVAIVRMIVLLVRNRFSANDDKITKSDVFILIFLLSLCVSVAFFTYQGPLSLLSILGTMIVTISVWQKDALIYKILGIPNSICWLIYNAFIWSPTAVVLESVLLVIIIINVIISIVKIVKEKKANKNIQFSPQNQVVTLTNFNDLQKQDETVKNTDNETK